MKRSQSHVKRATLWVITQLNKIECFLICTKKILLFISEDVERNPGPPLEKGLCVVHVNARSQGKKLDLLIAIGLREIFIIMRN